MRPSPRSLLVLAALIVGASTGSSWWVRHNDRGVGEQVAALAQPGDIRMLASETCGICVEARIWLTRHRVPFAECTVERDAACAAEFRATGAPGTPVFVIRGQTLVGFDPAQLQAMLQPRL